MRDHKIEIVSNEERQPVEQMLMRELRSHGGETDEGSYKQSAKDLPRKSRY